jgi:DNA-binding transcriptional ArsR family regulator
MAYSSSAAAVLAALGDPTRRDLLEVLREGPRAVVDIAAAMPVSRPAVSQHLRVLRESGLASERREGRRRLYRLEPAGLAAVRSYVEELWSDVLAAFAAAAEKEATNVDQR